MSRHSLGKMLEMIRIIDLVNEHSRVLKSSKRKLTSKFDATIYLEFDYINHHD